MSAIPNSLSVDLKVFFLELFVISEEVKALPITLTSTFVVITFWGSVGGNWTIHNDMQNNDISARTTELCHHITTSSNILSPVFMRCLLYYRKRGESR